MEERTNKDYIKYSICNNHTGKMYGINSISTSCKCNTICAERAKNSDSICSKCYAQKQLSYQHTTAEKLRKNYEFYTTVELKKEDVPFINSAIFRFESFGDLQNELQLKNYCTIASANRQTKFVLWTKNIFIIDRYCTDNYIPSNLYIIASNPYIDNPYDINNIPKIYKDAPIDAVFNVYTKQYSKDNNIDINCGSRKCIECMRCYTLEHSNEPTIINELLK